MPGRLISAPLIEIEDITIVRGEKRVLDHFSLTVWEGEHVALLGPNGCGKSTLIRALTRELYSYNGQGSVKICGADRWVISELRTLIGVVSEEPRLELLGDPTGLMLAVSGLLGTYGVIVQHEVTEEMWDRARAAMAQAGASHLSDQTVQSMSTGERRRCWIARALVSDPRVLVLDEPTNGLDLSASDAFHSTIGELAKSGITLLLVTHHLEEIVPEITRVLLMKGGRIVEDGTPEEVLTATKLAELFSIANPGLVGSIEDRLKHRFDVVRCRSI